MTWPSDAMTFYGWGFVHGITRGRQLADAEMATLQRWAVANVHAAARLDPYAQHREAVKARQIAREAQRQEAQPWPAEDPNPSARVLNGWPDLRRAS